MEDLPFIIIKIYYIKEFRKRSELFKGISKKNSKYISDLFISHSRNEETFKEMHRNKKLRITPSSEISYAIM
jgi:hypothetical protein